jgi:hypothetical protein
MSKFSDLRVGFLCVILSIALVLGGCAGSVAPSKATAPSGVVTTTSSAPVFEKITNVPLTRTTISTTGKALTADIMDIDQQAHRLYLADTTAEGVDVFDISTKQAVFLTVIPTFSGVNGVCVAKQVNKLYAGLNSSAIAIIDINPASARLNKIIATIDTRDKTRSDCISYDPVDNKVYAASSNNLLTVIDGTTDKMITQITGLGPGLIQSRYNAKDGFVYQNSAAQNVIIQIDPKNDVLVKKIDIVDDASPCGLAINPRTNVGLLGDTSTPLHLTFWDFNSQKVKSTSDVAGGADMVAYNPVADLFFAACPRTDAGPVMAIFNGSDEKFITLVPTAEGAHNVAYDETNGMVYTVDSTPSNAALIGFPWPYKK